MVVGGGCSTWWLVVALHGGVLQCMCDGCWCGAAVNAGVVLLSAGVVLLFNAGMVLFGGGRDLGSGGASTTKKSSGWKVREWDPGKGLGRGNRRGVSSFRVIDCSLTLPRLSLFFIFGILFTPKNLI
uniref:Uncharacterized protein n=1 Tax=Meloidogyne enterolobii TaxID=390850 RepID=A0A6V7UBR4_MELEN|nr:unnamed protein product [Meloidogyne enterolobii]